MSEERKNKESGMNEEWIRALWERILPEVMAIYAECEGAGIKSPIINFYSGLIRFELFEHNEADDGFWVHSFDYTLPVSAKTRYEKRWYEN